MGISMYEILSNKSNPWDEFDSPFELLKIQVESGERPNLQSLEPLYEDLDTLKNVSNVIAECWKNNERPDAFQVKIIFSAGENLSPSHLSFLKQNLKSQRRTF